MHAATTLLPEGLTSSSVLELSSGNTDTFNVSLSSEDSAGSLTSRTNEPLSLEDSATSPASSMTLMQENSSPTYTHSVPLLHALHWLPLQFRTGFKMCLRTYKTLSEIQPVHLQTVLNTSLPPRALRSHKGTTLN